MPKGVKRKPFTDEEKELISRTLLDARTKKLDMAPVYKDLAEKLGSSVFTIKNVSTKLSNKKKKEANKPLVVSKPKPLTLFDVPKPDVIDTPVKDILGSIQKIRAERDSYKAKYEELLAERNEILKLLEG